MVPSVPFVQVSLQRLSAAAPAASRGIGSVKWLVGVSIALNRVSIVPPQIGQSAGSRPDSSGVSSTLRKQSPQTIRTGALIALRLVLRSAGPTRPRIENVI